MNKAWFKKGNVPPNKILDKFADKPISRQMKYHFRHQKAISERRRQYYQTHKTEILSKRRERLLQDEYLNDPVHDAGHPSEV